MRKKDKDESLRISKAQSGLTAPTPHIDGRFYKLDFTSSGRNRNEFSLIEERLDELDYLLEDLEKRSREPLVFPFDGPPPRFPSRRRPWKESPAFAEIRESVGKALESFRNAFLLELKKNDENFAEKEDSSHSEEDYLPNNEVGRDLESYLKDGTLGFALFEYFGDLARAQGFCERYGIDPNLSMSSLAASQSSAKASDPVAAEIAAEVIIRWADRKKPENKGQPWAKGPVPFIKHWYGKWLEAGTLVRAHLRPDEQLYNAYIGYLRRCKSEGIEPVIDLASETRVHVDDPEAALKRRRKLTAESVQRSRANKIK